MTRTPFRRSASAVLLVSATALAGCATTSAKPPAIAYDDPPREIAATPAAEPPRPERTPSTHRCRGRRCCPSPPCGPPCSA